MSATSSRKSVPAVSRKSYTAVGSFGLAFFTYRYGMNPETLLEQGVLTAYGTNADCPAGRVLYENGKKIVPVQGNFTPILTVSANGTQVLTSYMVGVFDPQSGLSGFIDPNSVNFAINSSDLPVYLGSTPGAGPTTFIPNSGNPVVTNGNVLSLTRPANVAVPLPQYVGIARAGVDYLNFGNNNGVYNGPYALAISEGGPENTGTALVCGEGGNPNTTNWAGMFNDGNVYHTGMMYSRRTVGVSPPLLPDSSSHASSVIIENVFMGFNYTTPIVLLTYATFSRSYGTAGPGVLTYTLDRYSSTELGRLTIYSTAPYDTSTVNYYLIGGGDGLD